MTCAVQRERLSLGVSHGNKRNRHHDFPSSQTGNRAACPSSVSALSPCKWKGVEKTPLKYTCPSYFEKSVIERSDENFG